MPKHYGPLGRVSLLGTNKVMALISVVQTVAILTSFIRLTHRRYIRRLWWDDFWAALALLCDLATFVMFVVYDKHSADPSKKLTYASRWITLLGYTMALWASRLTISVTITRLLPKGRMRQGSKAASGIFGAFLATMLLQKIFFCGTNWRKQGLCTIPQYTGYMELATDNTADLWLILAPAYILYKTKLQPAHRRLIVTIFMCGILTIFASITHSVFIILKSPQWVGISGHIQVAIAMIVSNLLVLVTAIYRAVRRRARLAGATALASPPRVSSTSETRGELGDTDTDTERGGERGARSATAHTTEYSHLTLTELTDSRYTSTRTHITLTDFTDSRVASTQQEPQFRARTDVAFGAGAKEPEDDASVAKSSVDSATEV